MKKVICILLLLSILLGVSGCGIISPGFGLLNANRLLKMDDETLLGVVTDALISQVYSDEGPEGGFDTFNEAQKVVYVLCIFLVETEIDGLGRLFYDEQENTAAYLSEALAAIGAEEIQAMYDAFLADSGIDPSNLSGMGSGTFEELCSRYPFAAFDEAYAATSGIIPDLMAYIRTNIQLIIRF